MSRILFCLDSFGTGGTELHALKAIRALKAVGHTVAVLVAKPNGTLLSQFERETEILRYDLTSFASPTLLLAVKQVFAALRQFKPDVVHSLDMYSNVIVVPVARVAGIRCVVGSKRWLTYVPQRFAIMNAVTLRFAHAITANSETIRQSLVTRERLNNSRTHYIANILTEEMFAAPPEGWMSAMRDKFEIPADARTVGIVARLHEQKDHATFLRSFASVREHHPNAIAICAGDGAERARLQELAKELGIAANVRFVGFQPNVPNLNWLFDVAVLTSLAEGFPNVVLEAMAVGCPVVSTRSGGTIDIALPGADLTLCDVGDVLAIANGISAILCNPPRTVSERHKKAQPVKIAYSEATFVNASEEVYDKAR